MTSFLETLRVWLLRPPGSVDLADALWVAELASTLDRSPASDQALRQELASLRPGFVDSDEQLAGFLAVARELARRHLRLRPFNVQLAAAASMLRGTSVELATGEGKTLVGAIVALGMVRRGFRVHVLSANDYLATRDSQWMAPLLEAGGAQVAAVTSRTPHAVRREAYLADVVYLPVTEAGFDILRDRLRMDGSELVGIRPDAAVLDEADAVLLDEGRVPLVLAGEAAATVGADRELAALAADLEEGVHYEVDPDRRTLHLSELGLQAVERRFQGVDLFGADAELLARMHTALHAEALLVRDVDYVVENGRVRLVSQSRGRVDALQRWPEGLQEAVEAKERLAPSAGVDILDQILVRDLVTRYAPVVGMSATLVSDAEELLELYDLPVGRLSPNRPCIRVDEPDQLYQTVEDRDRAAIGLITQHHGRGQPVLVATQSVAESERFAGLLSTHGLDCVVLNAKNDAQEAAIIAEAGSPARITVSTQMAGRGTDIRLSGDAAERGGLAIIGLGRFPSRRLDDQLRGRSGRQGDPGWTVFLTSLGDDLITSSVPDHRPAVRVDGDGRVLDRRLTDLTDHAQRISEGQQHSLRQLARRYGRLLAIQRGRVLDERRSVLTTTHGLDVLTERTPARIAHLLELLGTAPVARAARTLALSCLDRRWSEQLAYAADVRDGIHLHRLAREDPLNIFNRTIAEAFSTLIEDAYTDATDLIERAPVVAGELDLSDVGLYQPGATWTYMVTDDHFGSELERIGAHVAKELGLKRR